MGKRASAAKISRPRLFDVVPRERLFELLDENRGRPLIWIASPPGSGKTALIASYLEARALPSIWYQIDASDADPATLFHYLSQAARALREVDSPALPRFVPEHLADLSAFATLYFRALYEQLPSGAILVLDNYQEAPEGAPLHQIIDQCVAETPPEHSVICISRQEAPGPFVRFAASGAMMLIGWDRLRLTLEEVKEVSARRGVTDGWLTQALYQQSQGWAAGVTLMLERLGHLDGRSAELPSESRELVFNYFASLIFDRAPESTRHVLLSVAFLPQVTPGLARDLSGRPDAALVLEDLYRRRMFTDRRAGPEPVYQFHALFQDFLRAKTERVLSADKRIGLLSRSAAALEGAGNFDAAMELWSTVGNWDRAVGVIVNEAGRLLNAGLRQTLERWILLVPESRRNSEAWLTYWHGRVQIQTHPDEGIRSLESALQAFRLANDKQGCIECLTTLIVASFIGFRGLHGMGRWLDELLAEIQPSPSFTSADAELKVWGVLCMALFHVRPWHPYTTSSFRQVEKLLPLCRDTSTALTAAMGALVVSGLCGDFDSGDRIARETECLALHNASSPTEAAWWFAQVGYLRMVEARYEEALESLERGCRIVESNGLRVALPEMMLWRYTVEFRASGWMAADATLRTVEAMPRSNSPMTMAMLFFFQARRESCRGNHDDAARLAIQSYQAATGTRSDLEELVFSLCAADVLIDAGRTELARPVLERSRELIGCAPVYECWRAVLLLTEGWLAKRKNDPERAIACLRQSLAVAKEDSQRYYLRFVDRALLPMFCLALREEVEAAFVQDMIRMYRLKPPKDAPENWPWPVRIVTLGRFEVQVNSEPIEFSRKLPRKTLLLLKAIIAHGGRNVPEQVLCDALWGDEEADAGLNALAITIVRLRKLLGSNEAVIQQGGRISLNPELCWVDAWFFERLVGENAPVLALLNVYGGALLPEEESEPWSVTARERLRGKFIDALSRRGAELEKQRDVQGALQCYQRGIDADPIVETFHQGLMRCYERLGRRTEALSAYRRLKQTLSVVLGVPPSESTRQLFQDMLQRQVADGSSGNGDPGAAIEGNTMPPNRSSASNVIRGLPLPRKRAR